MGACSQHQLPLMTLPCIGYWATGGRVGCVRGCSEPPLSSLVPLRPIPGLAHCLLCIAGGLC